MTKVAATIDAASDAGDAAARYNRGAIWFHWTIAALIVVNAFIGVFHESFEQGFRGSSMSYHKSAGVAILFLSLGRLAWRLSHRPPQFASHLKRWEVLLAHATHRLFYVLMIAVPLAGWVFVSAAEKRRPISVFGMFDVPFLPVPRSQPVSGAGHEAHELLAYGMIALLLLHVAGALKHQFFDRDNELGRMVPLLSPGRAARSLERPDP